MLNLIETENLIKPLYAPCDPLAAAVFLEPRVSFGNFFFDKMNSLISNTDYQVIEGTPFKNRPFVLERSDDH